MNDLNVSSEKAIELLNKRLLDLDVWNVDIQVWCSRASQDIEAIFKGLAGIKRSQEIKKLVYEPASSWQGLAKGYINSYIDFIKEYTDYGSKKVEENSDTELELKIEVAKLQEQLSIQMTDFIKLKSSYDQKVQELKSLQETSTKDKQRIENLSKSILQIENISLKKIWQIILNLKWKDLVYIIGLLVLIFLTGFYIGTLWQKLKLS